MHYQGYILGGRGRSDICHPLDPKCPPHIPKTLLAPLLPECLDETLIIVKLCELLYIELFLYLFNFRMGTIAQPPHAGAAGLEVV